MSEILSEADLRSMSVSELRSIGSTYPNPDKGSSDQATITLRLLKDVLVFSGLAWAWFLCEDWAVNSGLLYAIYGSAIVGFILCYKMTIYVHEWGHFTGARLFGAVAPTASLFSPNVFNFDMLENSSRQFLAMSLGAHVFDIAFTVLLLLILPDTTPGMIGFQAGAVLVIVGGAYTDHSVIYRLLQGLSPVDAWQPYKNHQERNRKVAGILGFLAVGAFIWMAY